MKDLLTEEYKNFIREHIDDDVKKLALKTHGKDLPMGFLLTQIDCRQRTAKKLPSWSENFNLVFPNKLSFEQCSSEQTANYKASLFTGDHLLDMTGGLGVDSIAFVSNFNEVTYCDLKEENTDAARNNFKAFGIANINVKFEDSVNSLKKDAFDVIYLDPARRDENERKVWRFENCTPNAIELSPQLFDSAPNILIKASPMMNLDQGLKELPHIKSIHVIGVANDCKEILFHLERGFEGEPTIITQDLEIDESPLSYNWANRNTPIPIRDTSSYVFLPHTAINKARAHARLSQKLNDLPILANGTHIFTAPSVIEGFPGRTFKVIDEYEFNSTSVKKIGLKKANVLVRNFDQSVEEIRKRYKLKDGGSDYLIFFRARGGKRFYVHATLS
jgi:hypothetical protein